MNDFYAIHVRPWLIAVRDLLPYRPICKSSHKMEPVMKILGLVVSIDRNASAKAKWTRRSLAMAAVTGTVLSTGVAYAFWSTGGSGNGAATAGTVTALSVSAGSPTAGLVPGGTSNVTFVITNNNKANAQVTALTFTNTGIAGFTDSTFGTPQPSCTTTGVTWTVAGLKTLTTPIVIAPNGGTYTLTLTGAASMDTTSDNGCQGATFKMPVSSVTGQLTSAAVSSPNSGSQS